MGCCRALAKIVVIAFNVIFFLIGVGLVGLGIYSLFAPGYKAIDQLFIDAGISTAALHGFSYGIIGVGVVCTLAGFSGCCGAIKESRCLLGTYITVLVIIVCGQITLAALAYTQQHALDAFIKAPLQKVTLDSANLSGKTEKAVIAVQTQFQCCGLTNTKGCLDWKDGKTLGCDCQKTTSLFSSNNTCAAPSSGCSSATSADIYSQNCYDAIKTFITNNLWYVLVIVGCIAAAEILGICFGCIVCCNINDYEAA